METRPWGWFENLDSGEGYLVKKITVLPGKRLSLQRHKERSEWWTVVSGEGAVVQGPSKEMLSQWAITKDSTVLLKKGVIHRMVNTSDSQNLVIIEIQSGECREEDIERLEDDFGREHK